MAGGGRASQGTPHGVDVRRKRGLWRGRGGGRFYVKKMPYRGKTRFLFAVWRVYTNGDAMKCNVLLKRGGGTPCSHGFMKSADVHRDTPKGCKPVVRHSRVFSHGVVTNLLAFRHPRLSIFAINQRQFIKLTLLVFCNTAVNIFHCEFFLMCVYF